MKTRSARLDGPSFRRRCAGLMAAPVWVLTLIALSHTPVLAGSYAMLFYKNNYSCTVDCWVNGQYQGVIPPNTTKYMPVEGFVTSDSRWLPDGTLYQKYAYGGWSPSSPAEVVTMTVPRIGEPTVYWTGTFSAPETGSYMKLFNLTSEGKPIDAIDVEFAEGMPKGSPRDLRMLLNGKTFSPSPDLDGGASDGSALTAMAESPIAIDLEAPYDGYSTEDRVADISGTTTDEDMTSVTVTVNGRDLQLPVANGRFSGKITLTVGKNRVSAKGGDKGAVSKTIVVNCTDKPSRLWVELAWDGPGDVDLHVQQPNGQNVAYDNKSPPGGGQLDVDNTRGYGPEHYFISAERGDDVQAGSYQIYLVHYRSDGPVNCRVTVFKDEVLEGTYTCELSYTNQTASITTVDF